MNQELRSDRIAAEPSEAGVRQQEVLRLLRGARPPADDFAQSRREGMRRQLQRTLGDLEGLAKRASSEAPELQDRLRRALETLQLLGCRLSLELEPAPEPGPAREIF